MQLEVFGSVVNVVLVLDKLIHFFLLKDTLVIVGSGTTRLPLLLNRFTACALLLDICCLPLGSLGLFFGVRVSSVRLERVDINKVFSVEEWSTTLILNHKTLCGFP